MGNKAFKETKPYLAEEYGENMADAVMEIAEKRFRELCSENTENPKAARKHLESNLFPCMSVYEALKDSGISQGDALEFMDEVWSRRAEAGAEAMRTLVNLGGLFKLYPAIFRKVAKSSYGEAAGFRAKFYDMGKQHCRFDMTKCLFRDTCERYGCPELLKCLCHVDDVNNGNLHERLCWNRTKYMGNGDEICDFDIFVK